ncbi:MAG: alpha/beta hydrolase [Actinomycetota bacterium]|nr:alpha/beta hydrolase [Actinomycetota bacterium]
MSDPARERVEIPGPWEHRYVAAHGARFHVATCGKGPPVLLLHGFPQFWWAWRHQLPALAEAGFEALAMDLRGYGGSDKTPRGYDPFTLAGDVAGVIKSLGHSDAIVVGSGWGGYVGWATAVLHSEQVRALCTVSAPHPAYLLRSLRPASGTKAWSHVLAMQLPWRPERRLGDPATGYLANHLRDWSATSSFPGEKEIARYQAALGLWPAPHCALEYHRWLFRSRLREDGRRFNRALARPITVPTCTVLGGADPALPAPARDRSGEHVAAAYRSEVIAGVGHFAPEEAPDRFNEILLDWLGNV